MVLKGVKPILPLIIFTAVLNIFFVTGEPLVKLGFITITVDGIIVALKDVYKRQVCALRGLGRCQEPDQKRGRWAENGPTDCAGIKG